MNRRYHPAHRLVLAFLLALLIVTTTGLLAGCGGGDDEDPCAGDAPAADCTKRLPAKPGRGQGV